ncbi:helix-turn-helix domain-containing protein [Streptomyces sp. NPDC050988]|uniref:helix-turn-helix domain-containing protein n=1 Tax=Streptomyces sp. NPDC050988 TaxID=3365637 RepID=UPI0037BBA25A
MTTDYQTAREALGARLRELRVEAGIEGKELAALLGWQPSKVSRLQTGKQSPTLTDVTAWAEGVGRPEVAAELRGRVSGMEQKYRSWRRTLSAGHQARQEIAISETAATREIRALDVARVPGLLQTAEYARYVFKGAAEFRESPRDTEDAVRSRVRRQEALYEPGRRFRFLVWEAALYVQTCPPDVLAGQLDRLSSVIGLDTVELGVLPLATPLRRAPSHSFWIYDRRLVIVETISTEMWLDDADSIALYERAWEWLSESAAYDTRARHLIARARAALDLT